MATVTICLSDCLDENKMPSILMEVGCDSEQDNPTLSMMMGILLVTYINELQSKQNAMSKLWGQTQCH